MTDAGGGRAAPRPRRILLLVAPAGSGKGTQAGILARRLGLWHLATGDLFRRALRDGTPLGQQAQAYMARGELVPDEITVALLAEHLDRPEASAGVILDGFPRTAAQAEALDALLAARGESVERVISLEVPTDELVARLAGRWVCPSCGTPYHLQSDPPREPGICDRDGTRLVQREDDREEVVRARLALQDPPMREVLAHYAARGRVRSVDGRGPIPAVTARVAEAVAAAVGDGQAGP